MENLFPEKFDWIFFRIGGLLAMVNRTTEGEKICFGNTSQHYPLVLLLLSFVGVRWRFEVVVEGGSNDIDAHIWICHGHDGRNDLGGNMRCNNGSGGDYDTSSRGRHCCVGNSLPADVIIFGEDGAEAAP